MRNSTGTGDRWIMALTAGGMASSAAVAFFMIRGDYLMLSSQGLGALGAGAALVIMSALMGAAYFAKGRSSRALIASQSIAWVVMLRAALDVSGGMTSPAYPLVFVFAAIAGAYAPAFNVGLGIFVFMLLESSQGYVVGLWPSIAGNLISHFAGLIAVAGVMGALFRSERRKAAALGEELEIYRRGQASFDENANEFRSIREEGRGEQLRESVVRLQDAFHRTLSDLCEILKPYTCILFTQDPKLGRMCFRDAITGSEKLNRSAQIGEGEGLLGWVWREQEALRLTNFSHPPENLVYYFYEENIQSLLAVPIIRNGSGVVEGILVVDSLQEGYFTTEDERLVWLAANHMMKELETAEQRRREINEARVSHALYKVSEVLNSSIDLEEVLDATMACVTRIVEADMVVLALYDDDAALSTVIRAEGENAEAILGKTFTPDESLVGWVTTPEQYLYYPDFSKRRIQKPLFGKNFPPIKGIGTFFCYPLVSGAEFMGSITTIFVDEEGAINDYERNALATTARMAATSIANANLHRRVAQLATTDGLTGLYNHRYFQDRLTEKMEEARRHPTRHTLIMVDIDHFKKVNDTYGHPVGDVVLREIARLLRDSIRNVDIAARYGGEEFVLLLVHTPPDGALKLAERIRKQASKLTFKAEEGSFRITISMGIATFPDDARSKQTFIERADHALYHAKETGRNRVVNYADIKEETSPEPLLAERY